MSRSIGSLICSSSPHQMHFQFYFRRFSRCSTLELNRTPIIERSVRIHRLENSLLSNWPDPPPPTLPLPSLKFVFPGKRQFLERNVPATGKDFFRELPEDSTSPSALALALSRFLAFLIIYAAGRLPPAGARSAVAPQIGCAQHNNA